MFRASKGSEYPFASVIAPLPISVADDYFGVATLYRSVQRHPIRVAQ